MQAFHDKQHRQRASASSRYGKPSAKPTSKPGAKSGSVGRRAGSLPAPLPPALPVQFAERSRGQVYIVMTTHARPLGAVVRRRGSPPARLVRCREHAPSHAQPLIVSLMAWHECHNASVCAEGDDTVSDGSRRIVMHREPDPVDRTLTRILVLVQTFQPDPGHEALTILAAHRHSAAA